MNAKKLFGLLLSVFILVSCSEGEVISFKGVPLDQPNAKDAIKKICQEDKSNKDDSCALNKSRELLWLSYGLQSHALAWVRFGKDASLVEVEIDGSKGEMVTQVETLTAKYGKPTKATEQVTNGLGTKFDKEVFTWIDGRGSRIKVESIYNKIDEGRLVIDSASSVTAKKAAEKAAITAGKEKL